MRFAMIFFTLLCSSRVVACWLCFVDTCAAAFVAGSVPEAYALFKYAGKGWQGRTRVSPANLSTSAMPGWTWL